MAQVDANNEDFFSKIAMALDLYSALRCGIFWQINRKDKKSILR
jgi:hypothetical protein